MMAKIWINGDTIICSSRKYCGKKRNCLSQAKGEFAPHQQFLLFPQCFQKQSVVDMLKQVSIE